MDSATLQANIDYFWSIARPRNGKPYSFGGCWRKDEIGTGTDCSGIVTHALDALVNGRQMTWSRHGLSTEDYRPVPVGRQGPFGTIRVARPEDIPSDAALRIGLKHGAGGGAASHMVCELQGEAIEARGRPASRQFIGGGRRISDPLFHQWFYLPGVPLNVRRGLTLSGVVPEAVAPALAGYTFVVRYLNHGPQGQLSPSEADLLRRSGVNVVAAWEPHPERMREGFEAGVTDGRLASAQARACGAPDDRPIYFRARWDPTEADQQPIDEYLRGAATVIGTARVGIYGGFWPVSRALNAGTAAWGWQTHQWSGTNFDQRVRLEHTTQTAQIDGIACDVNLARSDDYGQWFTFEQDAVFTPGAFSAGDRQLLQAISSELTREHTQRLESRSPLRALDEGAIHTLFDFELNEDASIHVLLMETLARYGDAATIVRLNQLADASPASYPDRTADINLARRVIKAVGNHRGAGQVVDPRPVPVPTPRGKHILYTASGTWAKKEDGYPADVARRVNQDLYAWRPVDYAASFGGVPPGPANAPSYEESIRQGSAELVRMIKQQPGTFALCGYSQGAAVVSLVLQELQSGSLQDRLTDLVAGVTFGNPMRQLGGRVAGGAGGNTRGISDNRLVDTPDTWVDYVNPRDMYTDVPDTDVGANITAIYRAAIRFQQHNLFEAANAILGALTTGPGSLAERIWEMLSGLPHPGGIIAAGEAAAYAIQFAASNPPTLPHIKYHEWEAVPGGGVDSVSHAVGWLNDIGARATQRELAVAARPR